ncbi:MAG: serine/threonine-protein kinase [Blastocatellia bacterium]
MNTITSTYKAKQDLNESTMNINSAEKVKEIFGQALEIAKENRNEFLATACYQNQDLYKEVFSLLVAHEEAESFLEKPAANFAAKLVKHEKENLASNSKEAFLEQLTGRVIDGKYLIEKQLGQGGMGAVYQAIHLGTKRPVALKVIAPQFMAHTEFVERFKREAEAAGRLSHPNVVNVTDFGIAAFGSAQIAYLVMEYLKGLTLGALLKKKGKLPISFTIDILEQVCLAIEEAHSQGIIHRDLKPDNIWLEPDGRGNYHVKVLDFGLAKLHSTQPTTNLPASISNLLPTVDPNKISLSFDYQKIKTNKQQPSDNESATVFYDEKDTKIMEPSQTAGNLDPQSVPEWLTRIGMVLGTPLYMSPEQCSGQALEKSSDIYSLGVIAYEMLTGEAPFTGSMQELIQKHIEIAPIPLQKKRKNIPSAIADLVMTALAKKPQERVISAKAFAIALRANSEGEIPLIHQAFGIYWKEFFPIARVSIVINFIFILFSSLLTASLIQLNFTFPLESIFQLIWWVFPLLGILLTGEVSTGAFTLAVKQFQETGAISSTKVISGLNKPLSQILITALQNYLLAISQIWKFVFPAYHSLVYSSFTSPSLVLENKQPYQVRQSSKELVTKFYSLASSLKLRFLITKVISFLLFLVSFMVCYVSLGQSEQYSVTISLIATILLPGLFMIVVNPLIDMATALLYFKAREANGEIVYQQKGLEEIEISEKLKFSRRRKVLIAISLVFSIVFSSFSYILIIPPFGKPLIAERPVIEKLSNEENAWFEYELALQDMLEFPIGFNYSNNKPSQEFVREMISQQMKNPGFSNLEKVALREEEFNEQQLSYLDSHKEAIKHLLKGAKRPKAQFYNELPATATSLTPNLLQIRALTILAAAKVRRLLDQGKTQEAVELALANYKMATDIGAEVNTTLISTLISIVCRGIAAKSLFSVIYLGTTTAEMDKEIARRVDEQDRRMPNAYQTLVWETQAMDISMEEVLIKRKYSSLNQEFFVYTSSSKVPWARAFPGLCIRTYNSLRTINQQYLQKVGSGLENWDFASTQEVYQELLNTEFKDILRLSPSDTIARNIFYISIPNMLSTMKSLYVGNSFGKGVTIFAAASAYKKEHGKFPDTLDLAINGLGLNPQIDVATNKKVGYRLEDDKPVIWLAGVDGQDNNGKIAYPAIERDKPTFGKDLVYRYGKYPLVD